MMQMILGCVWFLWGIVYGGGDDVIQIASRLAAMKSTAHRTLTATKDVLPLIGRIDKDLVVLEAKKQSLVEEKKFLLQRKEALQLSVYDKKNEQAALLDEQNVLNNNWERYLGQLRSFVAQQGIQSVPQEVVQSIPRATLLAQKFESRQVLLKHSGSLFMAITEDVRG